MSSGCPLVATTGGALPEVTGPDGETCFSVGPGRQRGARRRHPPGARRSRGRRPHRRRRPRPGHHPLELAPHRRAHRRALSCPPGRDAESDRNMLTVDYDTFDLQPGHGRPRHGLRRRPPRLRVVPPRRPGHRARLLLRRAGRRPRPVLGHGRRRRGAARRTRRRPSAATRCASRSPTTRSTASSLRGHGAPPRRHRRDGRADPGAQARRHHRRHRSGLAAREDLLVAVRRVPRTARPRAATSASTPRTSSGTA